MNTPPLLHTEGLTLHTRRTQRILLDDVSFSLNLGEMMALVGPPESGKTVLLKLLNRLIEPSKGQIYLRGQLISTLPIPDLRRQILLVLSDSPLFGATVKDALIYPLMVQKLSSVEIENRLSTWMENLAIPPDWLDWRESTLTLPQRRWLAIARALMLEPSLLLLDRPLQGVTQPDAERLRDVLTHCVQTQQMGVIVIEHQWDWLASLSTRYLYLLNGTIQCDEPASAIDWQALAKDIENLAEVELESWH